MCLDIKCGADYKPKPQKTENNITCYKGFIKLNNGNLCTPFKGCILDSNSLSVPFKSDYLDNPYWNHYLNRWEIEHGIHTYQTLEYAKQYLNNLFDDLVIYECVIPKGTEYYKGISGDYCSERIEIVKECKKN